MSIGAIGSGLWHSATALLNTPQAATANFSVAKPPKSDPSEPPGEAGAPKEAGRKQLADLQSWLTAQQAQGTPTNADAARARAAYAGTSAAAAIRP